MLIFIFLDFAESGSYRRLSIERFRGSRMIQAISFLPIAKGSIPCEETVCEDENHLVCLLKHIF
jgi:hypothetical protein